MTGGVMRNNTRLFRISIRQTATAAIIGVAVLVSILAHNELCTHCVPLQHPQAGNTIKDVENWCQQNDYRHARLDYADSGLLLPPDRNMKGYAGSLVAAKLCRYGLLSQSRSELVFYFDHSGIVREVYVVYIHP